MYHNNNSKFVEVHLPYLSHYILNKPIFFCKNIENLSVKKVLQLRKIYMTEAYLTVY